MMTTKQTYAEVVRRVSRSPGRGRGSIPGWYIEDAAGRWLPSADGVQHVYASAEAAIMAAALAGYEPAEEPPF